MANLASELSIHITLRLWEFDPFQQALHRRPMVLSSGEMCFLRILPLSSNPRLMAV